MLTLRSLTSFVRTLPAYKVVKVLQVRVLVACLGLSAEGHVVGMEPPFAGCGGVCCALQ